MPHFTVVPVKDQAQSSYDSLEGINWVDYRDTGQDYPDHQDTVSSDGKSHFLLRIYFLSLNMDPQVTNSEVFELIKSCPHSEVGAITAWGGFALSSQVSEQLVVWLPWQFSRARKQFSYIGHVGV